MDTSFIGSSYDIRAVYPETIDEAWFFALGRALARYRSPSRVSVWWDARVSSPSLSDALMRGFAAEGVNVVSLGLVSTDMCHWSSVRFDDIDLAVMVTASHNPGRYNGVKVCEKGGVPFNFKTHSPAIRSIMSDLPELLGGQSGTIEFRSILEDWIGHVSAFAAWETTLVPLRIIADAGNGVAGPPLEALAQSIGLNIDPLYFEPDGTFPNHPANPLDPETLHMLIDRVRNIGADLGIAFDGDADRAVVVDEKGRIFSGTQMTAIIAKIMLERHPGAAICGNTLLGDDARNLVRLLGGEFVQEYVGHVYIKERMRSDPRIVFAWEHSGHYYFRENQCIDSGLIAFLVFLRYLSDSGKRASEIWDEFHTRESTPETNFEVRNIWSTIAAVAAYYPDAQRIDGDGVTLRYQDWWCNIRPSSNEPLLRLNVEAQNRETLNARFFEVAERIRAHSKE